jgi:hypothetical protein
MFFAPQRSLNVLVGWMGALSRVEIVIPEEVAVSQLAHELGDRAWKRVENGRCSAELPEGGKETAPAERVYAASAGPAFVRVKVIEVPRVKIESHELVRIAVTEREYSILKTVCPGQCYAFVRSLAPNPSCRVEVTLEGFDYHRFGEGKTGDAFFISNLHFDAGKLDRIFTALDKVALRAAKSIKF